MDKKNLYGIKRILILENGQIVFVILGKTLQFNKAKHFHMYQEEVMVPWEIGKNHCFKNLSETDKIRDNSKVGSGFGKNISNWIDREMAYPSNVLHLATECNNKNHMPHSQRNYQNGLSFHKRRRYCFDPFMGSGNNIICCK